MVPAQRGVAPLPLAWPQVRAFRMARHHLIRPAPPGHVAEAAGDVCGIQAQLMSAAALALRARVRRLVPEDVQKALWKDRTLVKTWFVRGAVHLVPSADLESLLGALQPREARMVSWLQSMGLYRGEAEAILRDVLTLLRNGPLTRRELADRVGERRGAKARGWVASPWGGLLRLGCARGWMCFGPDRGNEVTFVRTEDWLPRWRGLETDRGAADLLRRYLSSFGPATPGDFGLWTNLPAADVRRAWTALGDDAVETEAEGHPGTLLRVDVPIMRRARFPGTVVRLVPNFDALLLGHREKSHLIDAAHYKRVYRKAGWVYPAVLVDGCIAGEWSYERRGRKLQVNVRPFATLDAATKDGVCREADDVARFLGTADVRVSFAKAR